MTYEFILTSLVVIISPGTGALYTIATALKSGRPASLVAAFGCTLGILPHMAAAITGLAAVFQTSATAFEILKMAGVAYLLYMAWQTWRDRSPIALNGEAVPPGSALAIIRHAIAINLLNPKLSIFFLAFLPQFVSADSGMPLINMILLSLAFMAMTFVVFALYGLFAARMRERILSRPPVLVAMRTTFALAFVALGARLALETRS